MNEKNVRNPSSFVENAENKPQLRKFSKYIPSIFLRIIYLTKVFSLHLIAYSITDIVYRRSQPNHFWKRILFSFQAAGPTFIKLGQLLSQRPEIPNGLANELEKLLDKGPIVPPHLIRKQIKNEIGPVNKVFSDFKGLPIASGSLAQVHEAKLQNNDKVAVKVLKPDLLEQIKADFFLLRISVRVTTPILAQILPYSMNLGFFTEFTKAFREALLKEVNFKREAESIKKFRRIWSQNEDILVPKVYPDYTTDKVLVMEFMEGLQFNYIKNPKKCRNKNIDSEKVFIHLLQAGIESIIHGFVHVDPHPANLKATKDGKIVILDFGMTQKLSEKEVATVIEIMSALVWRDIKEMVELILGEMSEDSGAKDPNEIIKAANSLYNRHVIEEGNIPVLRCKEKQNYRSTIIDDIIELCCENNITIKHRFILTLKSLTYIIQDRKRLCPDAPTFEIIAPYVYSFNAQRKLNSNEELNSFDPEVIIKNALNDIKETEGQAL
ncbi:hypothetical protein AKJ61_01355 [candidate division MSBL1 archaeon SCGC-AAA259B11]|uniref:Protein kinase domain-containing protein n=1 Tax=candidate division MSBL1 archaeon SCGC-AAA259B11 TaxID=1698260 RepID=A0A133U7P9_9EURY|nr:hypothetical protein AKJ61_01355 [candidate division MSBL1 archaeon SCGC-AAA259B11]